ncbi:Glycerol uptake facilitator protein [hydrothermal vent metagenome]|uniref:Glycerol uptake facilitator protein n=1 Tax=hydrothermal vent metagenome TaxID=652676 RepID=A0A3B0U4N4_9ZZZZ
MMNEYTAEFVGTMLLVLLGNGVVANVVLKGTKGHNGGWIVIALGWGLAVFVGVAVAGPVSGAHINPAVTIGLAAAGLFEWGKVAGFILSQMLGAATGAFLVWLTYKNHFNQTENPDGQLACFSTSPAIRKFSSNLTSEIIGTFVLMFVIFYLSGPSIDMPGVEDTKLGLGTLGALPVALLVTAIGLSLGGTTGYAINPARDLGPRIMHWVLPMNHKGSSDWQYSWIPIAGPIIGTLIATGLFLYL